MSTTTSLSLIGPSGDRVELRDVQPDATVGDLAAAIGDGPLAIGGSQPDPGARLVDLPELVVGARVATRAESARPIAALVDLDVVAGPDAGRTIGLGAGRHVVGRSPHAHVSVDDPHLEPFHAALDVDSTGTVTLTQIAGAVALRRVPSDDGDGVDGGSIATELRPGSLAEMGSTIVRVVADERAAAQRVAASTTAPHPTDPWRRVVRRSPPDPPGAAPDPIGVPTEPERAPMPPAPALVGAAVAAIGALVMATVLGSTVFALVAGFGAAASVLTWLVSVAGVYRRRRRDRSAHAEDLRRCADDLMAARAERIASHRRAHPLLGEVLERRQADRWFVRPVGGVLDATVGIGSVRWRPPIDDPPAGRSAPASDVLRAIDAASELGRLGAPLSLAPRDVVAFHGALPLGRALGRSVLVQLANRFGTADWRVVVVSDDPTAWQWIDWLPHRAGGRSALFGAEVVMGNGSVDDLADLDIVGTTLLVTDAPAVLTTRTGPVRRFLERADAAALVIVDETCTVPARCDRVLRLGSSGRAHWVGTVPETDEASDIVPAGLGIDGARGAAIELACLVDPEDAEAETAALPTTVSLADLDGPDVLTAPGVLERWRRGGDDPAPRCRLGTSVDGAVDVDLVRDGPHALIAGTTGAGKSELLRSLVVGLATAVSPEHLNVVLVDYKGGSAFDVCTSLPHTVGVVTDLDDGLAERALGGLAAELRRRERLLRNVGASDLADYRRVGGRTAIPRLLVVVDEFAALAVELPDFLASLVGIAQRGRSLGVHLVLATQRPAGVVGDDIRANTNLRIALRLHDRADSLDVVGDAAAVGLPRGVPGRAVMRLGPDELVVFQSAWCGGPVRRTDDRPLSLAPGGGAVPGSTAGDRITELDAVVEAIGSAARSAGIDPPTGPWLDPLPHPLDGLDGLDDAPDVVGLVDDPEGQRRLPLRWSPEEGSLALVGATGTGTTSALLAIAAAVCRDRRPDRVHLYVVDARGDGALGALDGVAHCGAVVGVNERERLDRLLARLVGEVDRRRDHPVPDPHHVVLMVDGWSALRSALGAIDRSDQHDQLRRIGEEGPAVGVVIVATDEGTGTSVASLPVGDRWVFGLADLVAARTFGVSGPAIRPGRPGRLRIASSDLEAQIVRGAPGLASLPVADGGASCAGGTPRPVERLPDHVAHRTDERRWRTIEEPDVSRLAIGLGADDLEPQRLAVHAADPVLVVGAARSGVTTALAAIAGAFAIAEPSPRITWLRRGQSLDVEALADPDGPPGRRHVLVVDDAHRIVDDGALACIAAGEIEGITLVAGARIDAVRTAYGHWTRELARSRCGVLLSAAGDDTGGDVFGVSVPRRPLVAPRPGLAWLVDGGPLRQVQLVNATEPGPSE